jgi:uncharacterized repeat protein (TIGR03803 family)
MAKHHMNTTLKLTLAFAVMLVSASFPGQSARSQTITAPLYSFTGPNGDLPYGQLIQATDGNLYGTTYEAGAGPCSIGTTEVGCGTVFKISTDGTFSSLYSFCSQPNCADGSYPQAGLVQATDGNFYGTTWTGGANNVGTVFRLTPGGTLTTLYSFCTQTGCTDGEYPYATEAAAAAAGRALAPGSFCLEAATTVGFVIDDTYAPDNTGGVSVSITSR